MQFSKKFIDVLKNVDDDYLIGLCNKGTVNRAKKDLASLSNIGLDIKDDFIEVKFNDVICTIKEVLAESSCTCQSSTMCRHRVSAILHLKNLLLDTLSNDVQDSTIEKDAISKKDEKSLSCSSTPNLKESFLNIILNLDDDYLIGLCNKGTVNRAKKDLASLSNIDLEIKDDFIEVKFNDVTCTIKEVLAESLCTCQSSTMCRHRISALLYLQDYFKKHNITSLDRIENKDDVLKFKEFRDFDINLILSKLGTKNLASLIFRLESTDFPPISKTSIVTVELPWISTKVKLLEPLEHSNCTCHSKSFCVHKAIALLLFKISENLIKLDDLKNTIKKEVQDENTELSGICHAVQEMLQEQMTTGLARMSSSSLETIERMASLCHTASIPNLEKALRTLYKEYNYYFNRSALYNDIKLLQVFSKAYRLALVLENNKGNNIQRLIGNFRDDYTNIGTLNLYLVAKQDFEKGSGFIGSIYYFLDYKHDKFYVLNYLRPVTEREHRKKLDAFVWNLPCKLAQAISYTLTLNYAKVSIDGKLSTTEDCSGILLTKEKASSICSCIYTDFKKILYEKSSPNLKENERLVLIAPNSYLYEEFDTVKQVFNMQIQDDKGRTIYVERKYKDSDESLIKDFEKNVSKMQKDKKLKPLFFGIAYREGYQLKLYLISIILE